MSSYHHSKIDDPYHWLEDPDSKDTQEWVEQQIKVTDEYLAQCQERNKIRERITELYDYPKFGCPWKEGKRYFFFKNDGLQNHYVLYVQDSLDGEAKVFFDPNSLSDEGGVSLRTYSFSESGEFFAYGLSQKGSDWTTIYIKTVDPNHPLANSLNEKIEWVKFSGISWTHDEKGFFYSRYPKIDEHENTDDAGKDVKNLKNHQLYYHKIGTPQEEDVLIFCEPEFPSVTYGGSVTDDGKYLMVTVSQDCDPVNKFFYYEMTSEWGPVKGGPLVPVVRLIDNFEAEYSYITNDGTVFYFKTNKDAPRYKIIAIDLKNPGEIFEVLPQTNDVLSYVNCVDQDKLLLVYIHDVVDYLELYTLPNISEKSKKISDFPLPSLGTIMSIKGRKKSNELFYLFGSFLSPGTIFHYTFDTSVPEDQRLRVFRDTEIKGFDANLFKTEQHFYQSKDGTKIPIFIVYSKKLEKNGKNPVWLYGYGGFSVSMQPYFSVSRLVWMQNLNGIFALANLRGGGEYGEEWHRMGIKEKKQNVFDDFHAAAEYLVAEKYTSPELITINGGSNGGLLVCACVNQRPDLYGCAVSNVGVLDMLKYHKFTIGHFWISDYGSSDNEEDFKYLIKYSPLHNIQTGKQYPAVLLTTADHDDRVSPLHSYKFIAELQYRLGNEPYQKNPLIIRIEKKAGHGAGKPTSKVIAELTDGYAFVSHHLGLKWSN